MRWVTVVCLLCLGIAAGAASEPDWRAWAEEVRKQHPLAGRAYNPRRDALIDLPSRKESGFLLPLGKSSGFVLLGEVHDNPAHHRLRAWLIERAAAARHEWRPAIVFEQIRADQQPALDQFKALADRKADDLFRLLEWEKSGWPPASIYKPLFEAVVAARLPIVAGSAPRERVRGLARGTPLSADERDRLRLDRAMPQPLLDALRNELRDSHCGLIPEAALGGMAAAQRYRDAHLADAVLSAEQRHGSAILIAGNGHVRSDRGVPWHIRQRKPDARVMSVVLAEVEEGKTEPAAYLPRDPEGKPAADLLIFTPRAERDDPCEKMRKGKR